MTANAAEFVVEFKANGETVAEAQLLIANDKATATVAGESEQFNLKEMSWFDAGSDRWITVTQCESWLEESRAQTLKGLDSAPADIRPFVRWSLEPSFKVERSGDVLRLTSGQVDYVIEGEAVGASTEAYFRYAVLNAYKKAITERKLPPFSELKVIEEMKARGFIPRRMTVTMPGIPRSPVIVVEIREVKE